MSSPRHRDFYLALFRTNTAPAVPREELPSASRPPQMPPSVVTRSTATQRLSAPASLGDHSVVKVMERVPLKLPLRGTPPGWGVKTFAGQALVETLQEEHRVVMRLVSQHSSFALYRDVTINLGEYPILSWSWKVTKLPKGGDVRRSATDDQAAQVYLIFPRWPFPKISSDVLGYVWDSRAPAGLTLHSPRADNVRLIVLESGQEKLGGWVTESRNVAEDYRTLFGREPPVMSRIAIMVDSNDTQSEAEAWFHGLLFIRPTAPRS